MKVIFSRKGFDGTAGGCPSPIINDQLISFPIPTKMPSSIVYSQLSGNFTDLVVDLTGGRLKGNSACHLDPDINPDLLPRLPNWRGALGQVSAAQGHLRKQGVQIGDVFLFWGLFQPVSRRSVWRFTGKRQHRIWGWLQIGEIIELGADGSKALSTHPWLKDHPHARSGWTNSNVLYIASDQLVVGGQVLARKGYGTLSKGVLLSAHEIRPSIWTVPDWLHPLKGGCGMSYNPSNRWLDDGTVQVAARGQEFVSRPQHIRELVEWLRQIITK